MATDSTAYVAGVCNINRAEIAHRRTVGYIGLAIFIVVAALLIAMGVNRWIRLVVFAPAFIGTMGFLQAKNKFCVRFASSGQENATEGNKSANKISDAAAHAKDKARAQKMNLQTAVIAAVITALVIPL